MNQNGDPPPEPPGLKAEPGAREQPVDDPLPNPLRRFTRPIARSVAIAFLFLAGVLALSWSYRVNIANSTVPAALSGFLQADVTLTVVKMDLTAITIEDFAVKNGPTIDSLEARFDLAPGAAVLVEALDARGVTASVHLNPRGVVTVKGLEALFETRPDGPPEGSAPLTPPFENLTVSDLRIDADTPVGRHALTGDISLRLPAAPALFPLTASIDLDAPGTDSALSLDAAIAPDRASVSAILDLSASHWLAFVPGIEAASGRLTADLSASGAGPIPALADEDPVAWALAALAGDADIAWAGLSVTPSDLPSVGFSDGLARMQVGGGQATLDIADALEVSPSAVPDTFLSALPEGFRDAFSGAPTIVLTPDENRPSLLFRPDAGGNWRVETGLGVTWTHGPAQATLTPREVSLGRDFAPRSVTIESLRLDLVRGLNLPRDVTVAAEIGPLEVDLSSPRSGEIPELDFPFTLNATLFGEIAPPLWAERADIDVSGTIEVADDAGAITAYLVPGGGLSAQGLTGTGDARLSPRIAVDIAGGTPARVDILPNPGLMGAFRISPMTVALPDQDPPVSVEIDSQLIQIRHTPSETRMSTGPFDARELGFDFGVTGIEIDAVVTANGASLGFDASGLILGGAPFLSGAISADMAIARRNGAFTSAAGPISLADGRVSLDTSIAIGRDGGVGAVRIQSAPIPFGGTGLATSDILPAALLADLPVTPDLGGAVSFGLNLTPPGDAGANILALTLEGFSIEAEGFEIGNVNGALSFDPLALPASFGEQTLSGAIAAPVLGRAPFEARFSVSPTSRVAISEIGIDALGGSVSLIDGAFDPKTSGLTGTLRLRRVDLSLLTDALAIDGVAATGRLSGLLPTRLSPNILSITNGSIAADGGGVLAITNPAVSQALASDNEAVQLLADAMENFEYDTLSANVEIRPDGEGAVGLSLKGANPDVLDGYPFDINVNLETDFGKFAQIQRDIFLILRAVMAPLRLLNPRQLPVSSNDNSG